jgi:hypothetical protein
MIPQIENLPDPKDINQAEYRAIHEVLETADSPEHAISILEEFIDWSKELTLRLQDKAPGKLAVVYDSGDLEAEPAVWGPSHLRGWEVSLLNKSEENGGRYPNTDPADITLLEAGRSERFPDYIQLT